MKKLLIIFLFFLSLFVNNDKIFEKDFFLYFNIENNMLKSL